MKFVIVERDVKSTPPGQDVHLVVATNVLPDQSYTILKNLVAALKPNGFVLLEESTTQLAQVDLKSALEEADLVLAGTQADTSSGKTYVLLKKRLPKKGEPIVLPITEKNLSWVENVKAALKKSDEEKQEVLLVSQGEELFGKIANRRLAREWKVSPRNLTCFRPTLGFHPRVNDQPTACMCVCVKNASVFVRRSGWTHDVPTTRVRW